MHGLRSILIFKFHRFDVFWNICRFRFFFFFKFIFKSHTRILSPRIIIVLFCIISQNKAKVASIQAFEVNLAFFKQSIFKKKKKMLPKLECPNWVCGFKRKNLFFCVYLYKNRWIVKLFIHSSNLNDLNYLLTIQCRDDVLHLLKQNKISNNNKKKSENQNWDSLFDRLPEINCVLKRVALWLDLEL